MEDSREDNNLLRGGVPDLLAQDISWGLTEHLTPSPKAGDLFVDTEAGLLYLCYTDGTWTSMGGSAHDKAHLMTDVSAHDATANKFFYSDNSGDVQEGVFGTDGQVLTGRGTTTVPIFEGPDEHRHSSEDYLNGTFIESFRLAITEDTGTIIGTLDANPSGDLTQRWSDGFHTYSSSTVNVTAGTASAPAKRYIYILQSGKDTLVEGAAWPATEHIKVAEVIVQTAALVASDGPLANRNWNDHAQGGSNDTPPSQGHHPHAWERLRWEHAAYMSGGALTWAGSGTGALNFAITAAVIFQMHPHTTDAFDTTTPAEFLVPNQHANNGGNYDASADVEALVNDSEDVSLTNRYYNIVIWGSVSSGSEQERIFVNLPTGSYNKSSDAIADVGGFDVFDIPTDFRGYAYLIQRVTIRNQTDSTFTIVKETDLRGTVPSIQAGGGTSAITTEFADSQFRLFDDGNPTKEIDFEVSGVTAGQTRTITVPDTDLTLLNDTGAFPTGWSDTGITGAELEDLSDGGATTLHTHAGIGSAQFEKTITIEDPTSSENIMVWYTFAAITIQELQCTVVGSSTPSVTIDPFHDLSRAGTGGAKDIIDNPTAITNTTTGQNLTGATLNDVTVPADSFIIMETTAQSGTVTELQVTFRYTYD